METIELSMAAQDGGGSRRSGRPSSSATSARGGTVVDRAIAIVGLGPAEFARRLSEYARKEVSRQSIYGCQLRGVFSRELMGPVSELTGIPLSELIAAKPKALDGSIVERAMRLSVPDDPRSSSAFAAAISAVAHKPVSRQMVSEWRRRGMIPIEFAGAVSALSNLPVSDLILPDKKKR